MGWRLKTGDAEARRHDLQINANGGRLRQIPGQDLPIRRRLLGMTRRPPLGQRHADRRRRAANRRRYAKPWLCELWLNTTAF